MRAPVRPNLKDIAQRAGVSTSTVSRALSGSSLIAEATVDRIRALADEFGYRPNVRARNFRTQKTMAVLIVVRDIGNPFYLEVFKGVERVARQAGYSVLMANTEGDREREVEYFEMLSDGLADGMILMTGAVPGSVRKSARGFDNVVVALEMVEDFHVPQILIDNEAAAVAAVNHLIGLGHTRIAHIAGPIPEGMSIRRQKGYVLAMQKAGLEIPPHYVCRGDFTLQSGERCARALLSGEGRPSAIFVANDEMAFGVIRHACQIGLNVPADLSVVGFDNIAFSEAFLPSLTTISQPRLDIGERAMSVLLDLMNGKSLPADPTILPTQLLVRETTAAPPAALLD
ncbi:LacI family DNA-binding transcriptional regulator [Hoeflea olei]|uniref:LacI family transcriptional regulator n=1 Tax=Hoeflea olei TaxID=1480615 RepID=A0A1C1Z1C9_9HYPH|nr:LacI family DNA-binding transcriptional regulator [Hoeflea olei]OCW59572.1 LacI family transcriptional regulator [Hoeflea olei]